METHQGARNRHIYQGQGHTLTQEFRDAGEPSYLDEELMLMGDLFFNDITL